MSFLTQDYFMPAANILLLMAYSVRAGVVMLVSRDRLRWSPSLFMCSRPTSLWELRSRATTVEP